uniref:Secreted protein n=1 Tax=Zea mays TaxID=4577 RepID=A0A804MCD3_MAIZE
MRCCAASLMSRALDASLALAWSSWSAPGGCLPVRYLYIQENTDSAATPRPPEVTNPAAMSASAMAAGTSTGLKITSTGVATVSAITVPARISPDSTSIDPPKVAVAPATSRRTPVVISHGRLAERARYPTCARCPELLPLMLELRLRVR